MQTDLSGPFFFLTTREEASGQRSERRCMVLAKSGGCEKMFRIKEEHS